VWPCHGFDELRKTSRIEPQGFALKANGTDFLGSKLLSLLHATVADHEKTIA
jgi:hypothetical protein